MLIREATDIINSRESWLFVGSGISIQSGYPSWEGLVRKVVKRLRQEDAGAIRASKRYQTAMEARDFPAAFSAIEAVSGRPNMEGAVRQEMTARDVNPVVKMLADWPFAGYITSNYDDLLERALADCDDEPWATVGNSDREIQKIGGAPPRTVWHLHGSAQQTSDRSRLTLTRSD